MKRTFIAVKVNVSKSLNEAIGFLRNRLASDNIKWVDVNNFHITLAFIGNTEDNIINPVNEMLAEKLTDFGTIDFSLKGFGAFKSFRDPKIIYTQVENTKRLSEAFNLIKPGLESLNIKIEEREFNPHLTIARIKFLRDAEQLRTQLSKYNDVVFQDISVNEVILFESILNPEGPVYKPLRIIPL